MQENESSICKFIKIFSRYFIKKNFVKGINYKNLRKFDKKEPGKKIENNYEVDNKIIDGNKLFVLSAKEDTNKKINKNILFLHGGAFVTGPGKNHWDFATLLVDNGFKVFLPDYPLAPESNFSISFQYIKKVYEYIEKNIINTVERGQEELIILGDSAGGGFSVSLISYLVKENKRLPSKMVLLSPWLDYKMANDDITNFEKSDCILSKRGLEDSARFWLIDTLDSDKEFENPIECDLKKFPPVFIASSRNDILYPDCKCFVEKLQSQVDESSPIIFVDQKTGFHDWVLQFPYLPEAKNVFESMITYLSK